MGNIEDIKRKLAALLAKAEATDNIHEAEAFLAKAQELMERYQIEMHELHVDDPMGNEPRRCSYSDAWIYKVVSASARYWGARVIWERHNFRTTGPVNERAAYRIFGPESARITHSLMIDYLLAQVRHQGRIYARDHGVSASIGGRNVGFAFSVRLNDLADANKVKRDGLASRALVPVDITKQLVDKYYTRLTKSAGARTGYSASAIGYANKISLAQHVTGAKTKLLK